ncbi:MAG: NAD(P)/FAD-dependent oxidoreductase [Pseudomonadota bacterium]
MGESFDTVIVGGGQAGLAMSAHLLAAGVDHVVLERDRIAESWRTRRWDSLVANGPAWHDRFPGFAFEGHAPESFIPKDQVAQYFEEMARSLDAPVRCELEVTRATPRAGQPGFAVETSQGTIHATRLVAATGAFQTPVIPPLVPETPAITQLHSAAYRNAAALPEGAVLVVGSGSSGVQIAADLAKAGLTVTLSVGPHHRPPRRYRGLDYCWWLGVLGKWDAATVDPKTAHMTIAVSGADGGHTVDFRALAASGITLVGMTERADGTRLHFADDLAQNIRAGDANYLSVLDEADAYAARRGLALPEEPLARVMLPDPPEMRDPIRALDLVEAGISTIIWATGYKNDFSWLQVDTFDPAGQPQHQRGVAREPGIYFLGLPWLSRRGSSFIWGVWHDAKYLADQIVIQRGYEAYQGAAQPRAAE